jgi:hypothetical protein
MTPDIVDALAKEILDREHQTAYLAGKILAAVRAPITGKLDEGKVFRELGVKVG